MTPKRFSELGLSPELLKAIDKLGFEQASPIQAAAIPLLLQGRDVVGQSQTGSGKTIAFAAPAVERVDPKRREVQVLVLCPTRELAVQVSEEVHKLAVFKRGVMALPIYGGQSYERQFHGLRQGAQIVIGTPGRIMDHLRRGTLRLEATVLLVLDEADEMLDMGFRDDIEVILQSVPRERQTVCFSATVPRPIQELIGRYARDPQTVRMEQKALTVPTVEQVYYEVGWGFKVELLTRLIDLHDLKLGMVFCNTKRRVDELVEHLDAQGYSADRLHGDMSQAQRDRVMHKFRRSGLEFLVATDVAARGIDVQDVQVVFNYDLPYDPEDYVHRIGRTGRAGRSGLAISFVSGRELFQLQQIERFTRTRIRRNRPPTMAEVEEARASLVVGELRATLQAGRFKRQDHVIERLLDEGFTSTDIISALLHQLSGGEEVAAAKPGRELPTAKRPGRPTGRPAAAPAAEPAPQAASPPPTPGPVAAPEAKVEAAPATPAPAPPTQPAISHPAEPESQPVPVAEPKREPPAPPSGVRSDSRSCAPVTKPAPGTPSPAGASPTPGRPAPGSAGAFASAKGRPAKVSPWKRPGASASNVAPRKVSRRTPTDQTRLYLNVGSAMGVAAGDVVGAILGETGLPAGAVGTVDVRERHLFVDVAADRAQAILSKLNRARIKGNRVKAKVA